MLNFWRGGGRSGVGEVVTGRISKGGNQQDYSNNIMGGKKSWLFPLLHPNGTRHVGRLGVVHKFSSGDHAMSTKMVHGRLKEPKILI